MNRLAIFLFFCRTFRLMCRDRLSFHAAGSEVQYHTALALNSARHDPDVDYLFTNQTAWSAGDGWAEVVPWGEHPNVKGVQVVTPETVQPMITAFNALKAKKGKSFRGVPIYDRHPTTAELDAGLKPLGRVVNLKAGATGLEVQRVLNTLGKENDEQGFLPYPSIACRVKRLPDGKVTFAVLDHIAMCEHPNIGAVPAWTNSAMEDTRTQTEDINMDLKKLAASLGLPETATLADIEGAVSALKSKVGTTEAACNTAKTDLATAQLTVNTLTGERDAASRRAEKAEGDLLTINAERVETTLTLAINTGVITKADEPAWRTKLATNSSSAAAFTELSGLKPKLDTAPLAINRRTINPAVIAVNQAEEKIQELVTNCLAKHGGDALKAWRAVVSDPANAAIVKAANGEVAA